jgi:hypothetical protein
MVTDIFMDWSDVPDPTGLRGSRRELAGWEIENVDERTRRKERIELEELPEKMGCPVDVFVRALLSSSRKTKTGPAPKSGLVERARLPGTQEGRVFQDDAVCRKAIPRAP